MKSKFTIGQKAVVTVDIPTSSGMLYKDTKVKIRDFDSSNNKIRVTDDLGKIWVIPDNFITI